MPATSDDDLRPISALQHLLYCPRQCALIHLEQLWAENVSTTEGKHLHEKADRGRPQQVADVRVTRGLMIRSMTHRLIGKADVVEFHADGSVVPIEYKRGRPKAHDADLVQLCAQALCLEEMLARPIERGAIFYGQTRRRMDVSFNAPLRQLTLETIARLHELFESAVTPPPVYEKAKCESCSLIDLCLPKANKSASGYLKRQLALNSFVVSDDPFNEEE